jgi:hypothetical protein
MVKFECLGEFKFKLEKTSAMNRGSTSVLLMKNIRSKPYASAALKPLHGTFVFNWGVKCLQFSFKNAHLLEPSLLKNVWLGIWLHTCTGSHWTCTWTSQKRCVSILEE